MHLFSESPRPHLFHIWRLALQFSLDGPPPWSRIETRLRNIHTCRLLWWRRSMSSDGHFYPLCKSFDIRLWRVNILRPQGQGWSSSSLCLSPRHRCRLCYRSGKRNSYSQDRIPQNLRGRILPGHRVGALEIGRCRGNPDKGVVLAQTGDSFDAGRSLGGI